MKESLKIEKGYSDEHLKEIYVEVTTENLWANITYYTDVTLSEFKELNELIDNFVENLKPFEWVGGDNNFKMKIYPRDKLGHIIIDFSLENMQTGYLDGHRYCECSLTFDLGQIEKLGKQILNFIDYENYSVEIDAMD